jgi:hypothetical protein
VQNLKKYLVISLILLTGIWSCFEGDPLHDITGERLNNYGGIYRDTLYAIADTSIIEGKVSTESSGKLLLGSFADFDARFLVKFGNLLPDATEIDSLHLILTAVSNLGEPLSTITGSAHLVTEDWEESINKDDDWDYRTKIDYSPETTAEFEMSENSEGIYKIDLPPALMTSWQDTTGGNQNFGMLLDFSNAGYIKEFRSVDGPVASQKPRLAVIYYDEAQDSTFHDTLLVEKDASLIDFNGNIDPQNINIASGYSIRSFFKFDLDSIPPLAAMSSMNFVFKRDTINSIMNKTSLEEMTIRTVTTDFDLLPYYETDSTFTTNIFYSLTLVEDSDNILELNPISRGESAQNFFQDIINGDIQFKSFLVHYRLEGEDISVYTIKNHFDPDPTERPQLIIEYYLVPEPRL